jgi:hypothetical protein
MRVLVQQEGQAATLDGLLRGGLALERGAGFRQEIVGERRAKGRQRTGHGGHPSRGGKKERLSWRLLYDILCNPDIICETDH